VIAIFFLLALVILRIYDIFTTLDEEMLSLKIK